MSLTEKEILDTPNSLRLTCEYFDGRRTELKDFFSQNRQRKFTFIGCGSSYMLAKGAAALFRSFPETAACAIPAGDYIIDPDFWRESVNGSIIVAFSRSGRTSEIVRAVNDIKNVAGSPVVSVTMERGSDLEPVSDLSVILDWCYDKSVCQTRTVTNLYAASLFLASAYSGDEELESSVRAACEGSVQFQKDSLAELKRISKADWRNVVVLADGPVCGIAEEGALAFTEIAMMIGRYFHLLDYRHGPIVMSSESTLTLMLLRPGEANYQNAMVRDVIKRSGTVVTVSEQDGNPHGSSGHLQITGIKNFAAWGIQFIYVAQMLALLKAEATGGNPDVPKGLDAYITL